MLTIQDVGKAILTGTPSNFYVFVGTEYGVKQKYLRILENHYGRVEQRDTVLDLIKFFNKKQLFKPMPTLYVVRYDDTFIASLTKDSESLIDKTNIIGTIVCIYESEKDTSKLSKYLPDHTVSIDPVADHFVVKYLMNDFPDLPPDLIKNAVAIKRDYAGAYAMCSELSYADPALASSYSMQDLAAIFTAIDEEDDTAFKTGVAARNFGYCISVLDKYSGKQDQLFYSILSVLIELERGLSSQNNKCMYGKYLKCWTPSDIYNMFMATYAELATSRNSSYYNVYDGLVCVLSLMSAPSISR